MLARAVSHYFYIAGPFMGLGSWFHIRTEFNRANALHNPPTVQDNFMCVAQGTFNGILVGLTWPMFFVYVVDRMADELNQNKTNSAQYTVANHDPYDHKNNKPSNRT